ncbi:regulator of G-protein signaling 5 [Brienomyrus brachyistius]|uniref:regulator of G-protein signaling 5 n=1 Tax=Brienomyrus brachyistius TaxID=42636 RepID=UPI0020B2A99D|nr:regulator of G-protein signaling 5 [Brienomyrus brachyistius]
MCRGLASFPSSCLEKAKGMRVKISHLAERHEWTHKYRASEKVLPDLEALLSNKVGLQAFQWFLRSEFSEENLEFWLACEDYRRSEESQLGTKAQCIYSRFINSEALQEVNLDSETRESLARVTEDPRADAFDEAQQSIYSLMAKDSFPRFLRSAHCQGVLKTL